MIKAQTLLAIGTPNHRLGVAIIFITSFTGRVGIQAVLRRGVEGWRTRICISSFEERVTNKVSELGSSKLMENLVDDPQLFMVGRQLISQI
jgi:hypothetical protein